MSKLPGRVRLRAPHERKGTRKDGPSFTGITDRERIVARLKRSACWTRDLLVGAEIELERVVIGGLRTRLGSGRLLGLG